MNASLSAFPFSGLCVCVNSPNQERSCEQLWVPNLRLSEQLERKHVIKSQQMRFDANKPVSINLDRIIRPFANRELIYPPLANRFLISFRRLNANFKRFHLSFLFEWSKCTWKSWMETQQQCNVNVFQVKFGVRLTWNISKAIFFFKYAKQINRCVNAGKVIMSLCSFETETSLIVWPISNYQASGTVLVHKP